MSKITDYSFLFESMFGAGALDGITRESVESQLTKSGNKLVKRSSVSGSSIDLQI